MNIHYNNIVCTRRYIWVLLFLLPFFYPVFEGIENFTFLIAHLFHQNNTINFTDALFLLIYPFSLIIPIWAYKFKDNQFFFWILEKITITFVLLILFFALELIRNWIRSPLWLSWLSIWQKAFLLWAFGILIFNGKKIQATTAKGLLFVWALVKRIFNRKNIPTTAIKNIILVIVSSLVALFLVESIFRYVLLQAIVPPTERAFSNRYCNLWPHTIEPQKPEGVFRILGLADSFGWADFENNYHFIIEDSLKRKGKKVEVVNFSIRGSSIYYEYQNLKRHGERFHPDLLLLGFFVGNDFTDFASESHMIYRYGDFPTIIPNNESIFSTRIHLFEYITALKRIYEEKSFKFKELEIGKVEQVGGFSKKTFLSIEKGRMEICKKNQSNTFADVFRTIDEVRKYCNSHKIPFVMVIHPDQYQVEISLQKELNEELGVDFAEYDLEKPQRLLLNYCIERNILCLDLLKEFQRMGAKGGLYKLRDTHYNVRGNLLSADLIEFFLQEHNLLP